MGPKKDHSNYWYPALYHHGADNQYTKVPSSLTVYYHFDPVNGQARTMFNHSQKIMAGNPFLRHDDLATNKATKSIQWWCHGPPSGPDPKQRVSFPEGVTSCGKPYAWPGFSAEIWFPFCYDGSDEFDAADPNKHVTYGDGDSPQGGNCPSTHPIVLPQLFMEFHFNIEQFKDVKKAERPWVLAPGDPIGSGMHADFINGWEDGTGSLADAMSVDSSGKTKCYVGESGGGAGECFELVDDDTKAKCKIAQSKTEDVVGPFASLPGCNPEQAGPGDATPQSGNGCVGGASSNPGGNKAQPQISQTTSMPTPVSSTPEVPQQSTHTEPTEGTQGSTQGNTEGNTKGGSSSTSGGGNPASVSITNGDTWTYQGCYSDLVPDRNVRALGTWGTGATSTDCATHCVGAGFSISGTEYGGQCFCGNALKQSKKLDDGQCNMRCKNSMETCGGNSALSVYAKQGANLGLKRREHLRHHLKHHGRST
ncbi:uncharacterized protein KY384_008235 [Bacidia gigantensis]|uniref:uncharacterized protein n=1 Tax=Bacidia gigantensis TaxID=2732470 RepID=UPI001D039262|nr:uncharacterized protein KY384_008235 [Bacidia gigantensis]KAG8526806.1 hypothetical protein KY384_008235 [Bacidia gigantensis]